MLWDDFVNSYWRDWRRGDRSKDRDKLEDGDWLLKWLEERSLSAPVPVEADELTQLKELRSLLFAAVEKLVAGATAGPELVEQLNVHMAKGPVVRQLQWQDGGPSELSLVPLAPDWDQVKAAIAGSFSEALLDKDPSRFRICENPDCLWVYYDDTRNHSKRYCDDKMCGNLMKVRRFRARKKAELEQKQGES